MKKVVWAIAILGIIGLGVSAYSYLHNQGAASGEFCSIGDTFNCDIVNKGPYGKIGGIPVSVFGIFGYSLMAIAAFLKLRNADDKGMTNLLFVMATGGFAFSLYLTGIEAFVLHTYCMLCLTSQALMLFLFIFATKLWYNENKQLFAKK